MQGTKRTDWLNRAWERVMQFAPLEAARRCTVPDCQREVLSRGLCRAHYNLAKYHYGPRAEQMKARPR